jgi:hypothetical protein
MNAKAPHTGAARPIKGGTVSKAKHRNDNVKKAETQPAIPVGKAEALRQAAVYGAPVTTVPGQNEAVHQASRKAIPAEQAKMSGAAEALKNRAHSHHMNVE